MFALASLSALSSFSTVCWTIKSCLWSSSRYFARLASLRYRFSSFRLRSLAARRSSLLRSYSSRSKAAPDSKSLLIFNAFFNDSIWFCLAYAAWCLFLKSIFWDLSISLYSFMRSLAIISLISSSVLTPSARIFLPIENSLASIWRFFSWLINSWLGGLGRGWGLS